MTEFRKTGSAQSKTRATDGTICLTTFIPMKIVRHRARKVIVRPGESHPVRRGSLHGDATLLNALARAVYWQDRLDSGQTASVAELAQAEGLEKVRVQKTLKLARLAPEIVEAIAMGREPTGLSLEFFMRQELPGDWDEQAGLIKDLGNKA